MEDGANGYMGHVVTQLAMEQEMLLGSVTIPHLLVEGMSVKVLISTMKYVTTLNAAVVRTFGLRIVNLKNTVCTT